MHASIALCALGCAQPEPADAGLSDAASDGATGAPMRDAGRRFEGCLYGRPNEHTGLSDDQCKPTCDGWNTPEYPAENIAVLAAAMLLNPPETPTSDPYQAPPPASGDGTVCGLSVETRNPVTYRLETFASTDEAERQGAQVTHHGACGLCSSLTDLAVYIREPDLTGPVRACGFTGIREGDAAARSCLRGLGFTEPCAEIWFYNIRHTREQCASECLSRLDDPYNQADGTLNPCLACDERESGPVFKVIAGRTRRNSGLPTAICRPCEGVAQLVHRY